MSAAAGAYHDQARVALKVWPLHGDRHQVALLLGLDASDARRAGPVAHQSVDHLLAVVADIVGEDAGPHDCQIE